MNKYAKEIPQRPEESREEMLYRLFMKLLFRLDDYCRYTEQIEMKDFMDRETVKFWQRERSMIHGERLAKEQEAVNRQRIGKIEGKLLPGERAALEVEYARREREAVAAAIAAKEAKETVAD